MEKINKNSVELCVCGKSAVRRNKSSRREECDSILRTKDEVVNEDGAEEEGKALTLFISGIFGHDADAGAHAFVA